MRTARKGRRAVPADALIAAGTAAHRGLARVALSCVVVYLGATTVASQARAAPPSTGEARVETAGVQDDLESEALRDQLGTLASTLEQTHPGMVIRAAVRDVTYGYEIDVSLTAGDVESTDQLRCTPCGVGEVITNVREHLASKLADMQASGSGEEAAAGETSTEATDREVSEAPSPASPVARQRFLVGASTVGVGVIGVGVGVGLAVRDDKALDGGAAGVERSTTRPIGYAVMGVGVGLVAVGATLMTIYRPRASSGDVARIRLFPSIFDLSAPSAGIRAIGRF